MVGIMLMGIYIYTSHTRSDQLLNDTFDKAAEVYPWVDNFRDRSITEIEIRHAILNDVSAAMNTLCYIKSGSSDCELLDNLKRELASKFIVQKYSDPTTLGEYVFSSLKKIIQRDYPVMRHISHLDQERAIHTAYQSMRTDIYIGGSLYFDMIDSHIHKSNTPLLITGPSGSGKVYT